MEVVVKAMIEVEFQLLFKLGGGWSNKMKLILISTLVEVEVEFGNNCNGCIGQNYCNTNVYSFIGYYGSLL